MMLLWPISNEVVELAPHEAHVWAVPLDGGGAMERLSATLSIAEKQRAQRFRLDEPRRRYIAGRAALRAIVSRYLGVHAAEMELIDDANGKPRLTAKEAPAQLYFNLAHSTGLALVAVDDGCEVGVDVERLRDVRHWDEIAHRYFHDAEVGAIRALAPAERAAAFLRCWTAKEAVLKALGVGLGGSLAAFRVPVAEHDGRWVEIAEQCAPSPPRVWLQSLSPHADYVAAIAIVGENPRVRCFAFPW